MTKRQAENYARLRSTLLGHGVSEEDFAALLRIERTLHRWSERECNGWVAVDDSGVAWRTDVRIGKNPNGDRVPNRERGALRRLAAIMARYPKLAAYHQGNPRGCALYVYEKAKLKDTARCVDNSNPPVEVAIATYYSSVGVALCF